MPQRLETVELRFTTRELMDVKNAYNLYDTKQAIRFLFSQQYPTKELDLSAGFSTDPDAINPDVVVVTVKARNVV
jgi:hypothetical protein